MNSEAPRPEADFGRDLRIFDQLPAKTRELMLLKDQAEKTTGKKSAAVNKSIRDRSKSERNAPLRPALPQSNVTRIMNQRALERWENEGGEIPGMQRNQTGGDGPGRRGLPP